MKKICIILASFLFFTLGFAQKSDLIKGKVFINDEQDSKQALEAAQVYWLGLSNSTFTDKKGDFSIAKLPDDRFLVISYVGLVPDTIDTEGLNKIEVILDQGVSLEAVDVNYRKKSSSVSLLETNLVQEMGRDELLKAACCNLSESFNTNPSVDVSLTDAVSGTKQIKMLGLEGPNVQYSVENIPSIRGFSSLYGLRFIPGAWVESIQMSKGTGSVVNGYEGISGQINVEERKAAEGDKVHLNAYYNRQSRTELNATFRKELSKNWSTALLTHGEVRPREIDVNKDGFLDQPTQSAYSIANRWRYTDDKGWRSRIFLESNMIDQSGGQFEEPNENVWRMDNKVQKHGIWAKLGKTFENTPWRSFGSQYKLEYFDQDSRFGERVYQNRHRSIYGNFIYQSILGNTLNGIKMGLSIALDNYDESLDGIDYDRDENVFGAFGEYNYSPNDNFGLVLGARIDHHNIYKFFFTPRLHLRYSPELETAFRISAGRSRRVANIFSDNIGLFASNRKFVIDSSVMDGVYGLPMTESWNFGSSVHKSVHLAQRELSMTMEFYHTFFTNSVIVDRDEDSQKVIFYEQPDRSYSNSFQFQVDYELFDNLDFRAAYRYFDVQLDYIGERREVPFIAKNRFFVNLAYSLKDKWKFDYTLNWTGKQRLPLTTDNPVEYQLSEYSPDYFMHNAQVSYYFYDELSAYLGAENIFGFRQKRAILSYDDPNSAFFDASNIWAPIQGAVVYMGVNYSLQ